MSQPVLLCLSRSTCPVLPVFSVFSFLHFSFCLSRCSVPLYLCGCPVLPFPFCLSSFTCLYCHSVLAVLSWLSCPGCPALAVISRLSCTHRPAPAVLLFCTYLSWLYRFAWPALPIRSAFPALLVPFCSTRSACSPGCPVPAVLLWMSCSGGPVMAILFWLCFSGCPVPLSFLAALFILSCPGCPVLFALSWPCCPGSPVL
jgi:hypothetical protein